MLKEIKDNFTSGKIAKADYINEMFKAHQFFFEYADWIGSTDIVKIEIQDKKVIFTTKYKNIEYLEEPPKFFCDEDDKRLAPIEILNFNTYERDEFEMICKLVPKEGNFFDIGGNIGFYSLHLSKIFPCLQIYTFEPVPKTFSYLKNNVEINKSKNINIHNFGFSDKESDLKFYYYKTGSGNASSANLSPSSEVEELVCRVTKLDTFTQKNNLSIDFIKCDVEGAELFVFQGGVQTIKKYRPIVFTEILRKWSSKFNYDPNEIFKLFLELDYQFFTVKQGKLFTFTRMDEKTEETNFFLIPKEKVNQNLVHLE